MKHLIWLVCALACAEVHTLTLRQAVDLALKQNPDVLLSRLDQQVSAAKVELARDPFFPKVYAGSGLAYTNGFPMSVEGAAPSIVQARAVASVYDRQKSLQWKQAREQHRGVAFDQQSRRVHAVERTVALYLESERLGRLAGLARQQVESARKIEALVMERVTAGRELPIEVKRAQLELARATHRVQSLESTQGEAAARLAMVLGLPAGDLVRPAGEERGMPPIPESAELAAQQALADHPELSKLASAIAAKNIEADAGRAARLPKLDLVAQYGLFARFNNYEDFFRRFQRHNGQIGVSLQVPVWVGPATGAAISAAMSEAKRLEIELQTTRQRIRIEAQTSFHSMERAASARQLARLDLDVARENLSIVLARFEEGRTSMQEIEQARLAESGKWAAYYESQQEYELARYRVLEKSGGLLAAFPPAGR